MLKSTPPAALLQWNKIGALPPVSTGRRIPAGCAGFLAFHGEARSVRSRGLWFCLLRTVRRRRMPVLLLPDCQMSQCQFHPQRASFKALRRSWRALRWRR